MLQVILALIIGLIIGYRFGWEGAHRTVATECEKLGSFYVGARVFHCTKVQEDKTDAR